MITQGLEFLRAGIAADSGWDSCPLAVDLRLFLELSRAQSDLGIAPVFAVTDPIRSSAWTGGTGSKSTQYKTIVCRDMTEYCDTLQSEEKKKRA